MEKLSYTLNIDTISNPVDMLNAQAASADYKFLLAFALDGVIWGRVENGNLTTDTTKFAPELRAENLLEARLFGEQGELYIWQTDGIWHSRKLTEGTGENHPYYDEKAILWGTDIDRDKDAVNGFIPVREGDLGQRHSLPIPFVEKYKAKITVRHYVDFDDMGAAFVAISRLVTVKNGE